MLREAGDAGAHGDLADRADVGLADALDDRARDLGRRRRVEPRQQHRELVAAEPERLAALAEARRDLR